MEKITNGNGGATFFNIVQATTIMLTTHGTKDAKRQSTSYVCEPCLTSSKVEWRHLIHTTWSDEMKRVEDM